MKNKIFIFFGVFIYGFLIIFAWCVYSLIRFDGYYSPVYVSGLSDPFAYHQKHIGSLLLKNGKEIDFGDIDEKNFVKYEDVINGFSFSYDKNLTYEIGRHSNDGRYFIDFLKENMEKGECSVSIDSCCSYKMPKEREAIEGKKTTNDFLYFYAKNKQIVHFNEYEKNNKGFMGANFISSNGDEFVNFTIYYDNNYCKDLARKALATFQFMR